MDSRPRNAVTGPARAGKFVRNQQAVRTEDLLRAAAGAALEPLERRTLMAVNPVIVYHFDEGAGTTTADASAEAGTNNGTLVKSDDVDGAVTAEGSLPTWVAGRVGAGALQFNGVEDADRGANDPALWDNAGSRVQTAQPLHPVLGGTATLAAWVNVPTGTVGAGNVWQSPAITGAEQANQGNDIFWGSLDNQGRMAIQAGDSASARTAPINDGQWHHVAFTRDSVTGQVRAFVDGVFQSSAVSGTGVKGANFSSVGALTLVNQDLTTVAGYNHLPATLDEVQVFDRVLSPQEVAALVGGATGSAPATPAVNISSPGPETARLTWTDLSNETAYTVLRADTAAGPFTEVATLAPGTTSFVQRGLTIGASYVYRVQAANAAGTSTSADLPVTIAAQGEGLTGYYFNSNFWGDLPTNTLNTGARPNNPFGASGTYPTIRVSGAPNATETVPTADNNWGDGSPHPDIRVNDFSTLFMGKVVAPTTGSYQILGFGDDDTHVYVNGVLVSSDPLGHGIPGNDQGGIDAINYKQPITLTQGQAYDIVVLHAEGGGGAGVVLRWITPTDTDPSNADIIPQENLRTTVEAPQAPTGLARDAAAPSQVVRFTFADASTRETLYQLERSTNGGTTWQVVNDAGINATSISDNNPVGAAQYRVVAVNPAGRTAGTAVTVAATTPTSQPGASGYYYNDQWWNDNAPANQGDVVAGPNPDLYENVGDVDENWGGNSDANYDPEAPQPAGSPDPRIRDDNFSTVFTGKITFSEVGTYTVLGYTDDDSYVWIDNVLASADPGGHGVPDVNRSPDYGQNDIPVKTPITITQADIDAGRNVRNFVFLQSEGVGGAAAVLRWITPSAGETSQPQVIPAEAFTSLPDAVVAPVLSIDNSFSSTAVRLNWTDASTSEVRYVVERSQAGGAFQQVAVLGIGSTSYTDSGLTAGGQYTYRVRAENFRSSASAERSVTTLTTEPVPVAPSNLTAYSVGGTMTRLFFTDNSSNETGFVIERRRASDPVSAYTAIPASPVAGNASGQTGTIVFDDTDAALVPGTTYVYRVRAANGSLQSGNSNEATAVAAGLRATIYDTTNLSDNPSNPNDPLVRIDDDINYRLGDGQNGTPGALDPRIGVDTYSAVWEGSFIPAQSGAYNFIGGSDDGIRVYLDGRLIVDAWVDRGYTETSSADAAPDGSSTFVGGIGESLQLNANQPYELRVEFYENGGGADAVLLYEGPGVSGRQVVPVSQLRPATGNETVRAPQGLTVDSLAECVVLNWRDVSPSETGFEIERSTDGTTFTRIGTVGPNVRTFTDPGPVATDNSTGYYYRVRAVGPGGPSAYSDVTQPVYPTPTAGDVNFTSFADPATQSLWQYNGSAQFVDRDQDANVTTERLTLTDGTGQIGSAFMYAPVDFHHGFVSSFDFQVTNSTGADGFAFVLHTNRTGEDAGAGALGGGGGSLGYQGIPRSVALKFDFYPGINQTGLYTNGEGFSDDAADARNRTIPGDFDIDGGAVLRTTLQYDAVNKVLTQTIDDVNNAATAPFVTTYQVDLASVLGFECAYVGFTGATGGLGARQEILNFAWTDEYAAPVGGTVDAVYVSGESWSAAFLAELAEENLGDALGYRLPSGAAADYALPWSTANRVSVKFGGTGALTVDQDDLSWASGKGIAYGVKAFSWDPATRVATWTLDKPLANYPAVRPTGDKVAFSLNGDGPNGVNLSGGDYNFRLNVVPGDSFRAANGSSNSSTTAQDYSSVRAAFGKSSTAEGDDVTRAYTVWKDVNTNGSITTQDLGIIRGNLGGSTAAMAFPASPSVASATEEMFSQTAIV